MVDFEIVKVFEVGDVRRAKALLSDFAGYEVEVEFAYSNKKEIDYARILETMISPETIDGDVPFAKALSEEIIEFGYGIASKCADQHKKGWMDWAESNSVKALNLVDIMNVKTFKESVAPMLAKGDYRGARDFAYESGYKLHVIHKIIISVDTDSCGSFIRLMERGNRTPVLELNNKEVMFRDFSPRVEYQSFYKDECRDHVEFKIFNGDFDYDDHVFFWAQVEDIYSEELSGVDRQVASSLDDLDVSQINVVQSQPKPSVEIKVIEPELVPEKNMVIARIGNRIQKIFLGNK